jgi:hypothetical protein
MKRLLIAAVLAMAALAGTAGRGEAHDYGTGGCHDSPFCAKFCDFFGYRTMGPPVYFHVQAIPGHDYWPMVPIANPGAAGY